MTLLPTFEHLADDELLVETARLATKERLATAHLIAALAEVDTRKLYLGEGCPSLFVYCTRVLRLSEQAAYSRIEAARAARRFPIVLELLAGGAITLTTVTLLAPHLTEENCRDVLEAARHKSKREVELQVATLRPLSAVPPSIRQVSQCQTATSAPTNEVTAKWVPARGSEPAVLKPLGTETYKVQFTISRDTHDKLRRVQDLLRHSIPNGDPAKIFDKALTLLLADIEKKKLAAVSKPRGPHQMDRASGRHVPADVKRAVWKRDGGQCAFIGTRGRCGERGFLEFHHREPFAAGGPTSADNVELRCRAHNHYERDLFFGAWTVREDAADTRSWRPRRRLEAAVP